MKINVQIKAVAKLVAALSISGCSTVTIEPAPGAHATGTAHYEASKNFFLWGLVGEAHVNVQEVCGHEAVEIVKTQMTFTDGVLGLITFGIYTPHSVLVWCERERKS